ncbi:tripartite motif-containing protein 10-like isoform X2 [Panulirus ornatus]|uniref:tripartite motif-containing protein 10-like isoform X2 n=1 Tax=Panulirus ornatus TaxID=150431 RepID=UPI003A870086
MAGVEDAVTCMICSEVYQAKTREPLVLPCGHTFCRSCLTNIYDTRYFTCPSCRENFSHRDLEDLPISFSLLSLSSNYIDFQCSTCREHGGDLMYWCRGCQQPLCGLCLYQSHPQGHDVQLGKTCLKEKKHAVQEVIKTFHLALDENKKEIKKKVSSYISMIKLLCQRSNRLRDIETEVAALSKEVEGAYNIENILFSEAKIKSVLSKQMPMLSGNDESEIDINAEEKAAREGKADADIGQQQTSPGSKQVVDKRIARLSCQDGKLLLRSFTSCNDTCLSLKFPSEVFLEFSAGNQCVGRVYIQLWCHLRRAQHFQALCLGTFGASYVGASLIVSSYNHERETLDVRKYILPDGSASNKVLMTDLEWGGRFEGPANEGIVMGSYYGVGTHGFGICTRCQPNGTFQCPFGEVLSGMEVVRAVISHEPISEVTITDCGLVIPELVP